MTLLRTSFRSVRSVFIACALGAVTTVSAQLPAGKLGHVLDHRVGQGLPDITTGEVRGGAPPNDQCSGAVIENLAAGSSVVRTGDNTGANEDISFGSPEVFEAFTVTECVDVTVSYCGTDPAFQGAFTLLFMGCPYTNLVRIPQENVSQTICGDGNFTLSFPQLPPDTYYFAVLSGGTSSGPYTVTFSATACSAPIPANDECAGAIPLTPGTDCVPVNADVSGANAGVSLPAITCSGFTGNASDDVWFSFEATATEHSISIDGSDGFDATVDLRAGACGATTSIACQDGSSAGGVETLNATGLTVGETYYVRVYDWYAGLLANKGLGLFHRPGGLVGARRT